MLRSRALIPVAMPILLAALLAPGCAAPNETRLNPNQAFSRTVQDPRYRHVRVSDDAIAAPTPQRRARH
jgi:hypothetical protein